MRNRSAKGCDIVMEEIYCAALADLLGYGAAQWVPRFFTAFGSYERAYKASRKEVASRGLLTPFLEKSWGGQRWNALPERVYDYVQTHPVELLTCQSAGYPELLRQLSLPPAILYVKGRLPDSGQGLAIVGSRKATDYGLGAAAQFSRAAALAAGWRNCTRPVTCICLTGSAKKVPWSLSSLPGNRPWHPSSCSGTGSS